ncbi:dTDP-4-dehydrorhamnose reductase [uncultured Maribacter sp.]|uniref:dTDP-4-dehydrorhamnose reductase n=1 Tax=uncultured Maribacter sp. TaxID=431308 RepID=UPI00262BD0AC|nr:dTDP-4-dehydrorhamnose reductase [uncultured Maribacter sp.]
MKHILVTGANGQLGSSIQEIAKNYSNFIFDFKSSKELDITNSNMVSTLFLKNKYSFCINCAAYTNVEQAEKTPEIAYKVNSEAVKNLAETCLENKTVLIHISTDYVFDGKKKEPYTISDIPNPINEYGKSKLEGEKYIQNILQKYFIIRTSWLYSKKFGNNFYKTILEKAKNKETLQITNEQLGSPTNTINLSLFILNKVILGMETSYGIFHFTDKLPMTWYEFARQIIEENNLEGFTTLKKAKNYRTFAIRPKNSVLE